MTYECLVQSIRYDILAEVRKLEPDMMIGQILFFTAGDLRNKQKMDIKKTDD